MYYKQLDWRPQYKPYEVHGPCALEYGKRSFIFVLLLSSISLYPWSAPIPGKQEVEDKFWWCYFWCCWCSLVLAASSYLSLWLEFFGLILSSNQDLNKKVQSQKPNLEEINREADKLLDGDRLDQGDVERVERYKQALGARYTAIGDRLLGIKNK